MLLLLLSNKAMEFFSIIFFLSATVTFAAPVSQQQPYEAIFNFGDSLSDVGNLILANPKAFAVVGKLPYGQTFFGRPTGRCSDGRLIVDFLGINKIYIIL